MKKKLIVIATGLLLTVPALAGPIAPTLTTAPTPTQVKYVSSTITAVTGGTGSRISPNITQALTGKDGGEYRVTSTQTVTWDGSKITASTRYVGSKVIQEVFN